MHITEIKNTLAKLQKGYDEKNPQNASALMAEIFSKRHDLLTLGTSSSEVCIGRAEVEKLIHDDWNGGWGDFNIDIDGAKVEADSEAAWFHTNCTVKYSFEDSTERNNGYVNWLKELAEKGDITPKQRLSFINWVLCLTYNQRNPGKREYLWPSEFSGMLIKENGEWKIATLHFSIAKPNYPDERFEELADTYHGEHIITRNEILAHNKNKADAELQNLLKQLEEEAEIGDLHFDQEQTLVFDAGQFAWLIALGTEKKNLSEDEIFDNSLQEIAKLFDIDLPPGDKLFQAKRSIAYALKETASGETFTHPIRLTAVVEKIESGYKFRHKHFSYPFYWIFEGKLDGSKV